MLLPKELQVLIFIGQRRILRTRQLLLILRHGVLVDQDLRRLQCRRLHEGQVGIAAHQADIPSGNEDEWEDRHTALRAAIFAFGIRRLAIQNRCACSPNQLARKPEERLLEVVVGLSGDVVVLQVLLSVEGDLLRLHLTLLQGGGKRSRVLCLMTRGSAR